MIKAVRSNCKVSKGGTRTRVGFSMAVLSRYCSQPRKQSCSQPFTVPLWVA
jgi:hypothetical protein